MVKALEKRVKSVCHPRGVVRVISQTWRVVSVIRLNLSDSLTSNQNIQLSSIKMKMIFSMHAQAFEHLIECALISFEDNKGHGQSLEFRPVKLLITWHELYQGLKSYNFCPVRSLLDLNPTF
ncbi:hypothetical protein RD792_015453 [Penstemon davidsonii]|uniref:Uncharacterized protein n=1 Tax=Penstemon davidsonii TaxID=160366 RepID=A0ABR0CT02_9LAMI|nr:hypothetical protein RD792_015453 [Penstemon davidsonii]